MNDRQENAYAPDDTDAQARDTCNGMHDSLIIAPTSANGDSRTDSAPLDAEDADAYEMPGDSASNMPSDPAVPQYKRKNGAFPHDLFGERLISKYFACHVGSQNGPLAIWNESAKCYQIDDDAIRRTLSSPGEFPGITKAQTAEVLEYVRLHAPVQMEASGPLIQFKNGVYNYETGDLAEPTPDVLIPNVIPWDYDADIDTTKAHRLLEAWACGRDEIIKSLCETIGVSMTRMRFTQCVMLIGSGANGKSSFMEASKNVLGRDNYAVLEVSSFGERFQVGALVGKLANYIDDMPCTPIKAESQAMLRKLITGEEVRTDVKNGAGFSFDPRATIILSANEVPRFSDSTHGMWRRFFAIPFDRTFAPNEYDPSISEWIRMPDASQQFIALGIDALREMGGRLTFTPNEYSDKATEEIKRDSNSVLQWYADEDIQIGDIYLQPVGSVYEKYQRYCQVEGNDHPLKRKNFTKSMKEIMKEQGHPVDVQARQSDLTTRKKVRTFVPTGPVQVREIDDAETI